MYHLTIIISTFNKRILNLENAVKVIHPQIKYLIIHQNKDRVEIPSFLRRNDIEVVNTISKGLSKSRNIGIKNCKTEYALIADDDVEYIEEALEKVLEITKTDAPDFASFKIKTPDSEPEFKDYPSEKHLFKNSYIPVASIEILLNINVIKNKQIAFDERFGLGTKLRQGEEEILIQDLIKKGLNGVFYPLFLVKHPYESTGTKPIKESKKYFLKGALSQRLGTKYKLPKFNSLIRSFKNTVFLYAGKMYIILTKRTYL
jgi:glycosyltransferase involved in cell wall biosynthesis